MLAFHGKKEIKERYLDRNKEQHLADETEFGIPVLIVKLRDGIFEKLPNELAVTWSKKFLSNIEPGSDLMKVASQFMIWFLGDPDEGIIKHVENLDIKKLVFEVIRLYQKIIDGDDIKSLNIKADILDLRNSLDIISTDSLVLIDELVVMDARDALDLLLAQTGQADMNNLAARAAREILYTKSYIRCSEKLLELLKVA